MADFTRSIELDRELAADDIAGSIAHVRGLGRAGLLTDDEVDELVGGPAGSGRGGRRRVDRLGPGPRGRPPQPRGRAGGADRVGRRQAPDRSLAQRPGRDRPAAVAAPRDRSARRRAPRLRARRSSASPSARARPSCPGRPTSSRPSRCCSPITCWPTSRWPSATAIGSPTPGGGPTSRRSGPARWPVPATRSIARRPRRSSASTGVTANSLDAVSDRDFVVETRRRDRARDGPPQPAGRGDHLVVEPARSGSSGSATRSRPARRSCRTRRTPTRPSWSAAAPPA